MAKRRFKLPAIQDLSKEQEDARALPLEGQHLIIGGPGTGKSVLALLRAKRLQAENKDYVFLVYNHLLNQSSRGLFGQELSNAQWQSWFYRIFKDKTGRPIPRFPSEPGSKWQKVNWTEAIRIAAEADVIPEQKQIYLVIDEGQDMPPGFYQCLANLRVENLFVVADQNQQIGDENSSRDELKNNLGLETHQIIELKRNYRNRYAIARLAREFYTGDPASPPPELPPTPSSQVKLPMLYMYPHDAFPAVIQRIVKMADRMPTKLLGIIAPNNNAREKYYSTLMEKREGLENGDLSISTFKSGDTHQMPFDEGGVMVINAQACKGLEFDVVFVADLHSYKKSFDINQSKRLFYVIVARAIENVIMLCQKDHHCVIESILPTDTNILERH